VCDVLVKDKLLDVARVEAVYGHMQRTGDRVEEAILALGLVSEPDMLRSLAGSYRVQFISTEKLTRPSSRGRCST
jgi:hypothetical protein